jgi:putative membrane protein
MRETPMRTGAFAIAVANLIFLSAGNTAWADERTYSHHMMWGGGWFMGPIMMLIFLVILVVFAVLVVRWLWPSGLPGRFEGTAKSAITILEERFARGEIEKEEFEEKRLLLEK